MYIFHVQHIFTHVFLIMIFMHVYVCILHPHMTDRKLHLHICVHVCCVKLFAYITLHITYVYICLHLMRVFLQSKDKQATVLRWLEGLTIQDSILTQILAETIISTSTNLLTIKGPIWTIIINHQLVIIHHHKPLHWSSKEHSTDIVWLTCMNAIRGMQCAEYVVFIGFAFCPWLNVSIQHLRLSKFPDARN